MDLEEKVATEASGVGKATKASRVREATTCLVTRVRQAYSVRSASRVPRAKRAILENKVYRIFSIKFTIHEK